MKSQSLKLTLLVLGLVSVFFNTQAADAPAKKETTATKTSTDSSGAAASASTNTAALVSEGNYSSEASTFRTAVANLLTAAQDATSAGATVASLAEIKKVDTAAAYYANLHGTCVKTQSAASTVCREETSPTLQTTLNTINTAASAVTTSAVSDSCSTFAKIASLASAGLTA